MDSLISANVTHDQAVRMVAKWLEDGGFLVVTNYMLPVETPHLAPICLADYLIKKKENPKTASPPMFVVKPDVFAYSESGNFVLAVEVSNTSDVKKEAEKLHKLDVHGRLIVTLAYNYTGEIDGIPIRYIYNLNNDSIRDATKRKKDSE